MKLIALHNGNKRGRASPIELRMSPRPPKNVTVDTIQWWRFSHSYAVFVNSERACAFYVCIK